MALLTVLAVLLYFGIIYEITRRSGRRKNIALIAIVVLIIYVSAILALRIIFDMSRLSGAGEMIYTLAALFAGIMFVYGLTGLKRYFSNLNPSLFTLFVLYMLAVLYVSLFSRSYDTAYTTQMKVLHFINSTDGNNITHAMLNALMYVPMGILFPLSTRKRKSSLLTVLGLGVLTSVCVETIQLCFHIGICDIDDILTNSLGIVIGYLLYRAAVKLSLVEG